jgi:hypothetical protein
MLPNIVLFRLPIKAKLESFSLLPAVDEPHDNYDDLAEDSSTSEDDVQHPPPPSPRTAHQNTRTEPPPNTSSTPQHDPRQTIIAPLTKPSRTSKTLKKSATTTVEDTPPPVQTATSSSRPVTADAAVPVARSQTVTSKDRRDYKETVTRLRERVLSKPSLAIESAPTRTRRINFKYAT